MSLVVTRGGVCRHPTPPVRSVTQVVSIAARVTGLPSRRTGGLKTPPSGAPPPSRRSALQVCQLQEKWTTLAARPHHRKSNLRQWQHAAARPTAVATWTPSFAGPLCPWGVRCNGRSPELRPRRARTARQTARAAAAPYAPVNTSAKWTRWVIMRREFVA